MSWKASWPFTGSEFDRRVWELIAGVAYGETTSYGEIARCIGATTEPRDVGAAVGRNPLCIIIPCHRVLAGGGRIGGFSAFGGTGAKRRLLGLECVGGEAEPPLARLWSPQR